MLFHESIPPPPKETKLKEEKTILARICLMLQQLYCQQSTCEYKHFLLPIDHLEEQEE